MKVNNASQCIENAKRDLDAFRDELGDIRDMEDLCVDIDGFLNFADFFFDGFVADIFVQSKIRDGQNPAVWTVLLSIWTTTCKARTDRRKSAQIVFDGGDNRHTIVRWNECNRKLRGF